MHIGICEMGLLQVMSVTKHMKLWQAESEHACHIMSLEIRYIDTKKKLSSLSCTQTTAAYNCENKDFSNICHCVHFRDSVKHS